jgi:hypothetical protein
MIKRLDIKKALGAALAAISMAALLTVPVGTASAGPKDEVRKRGFCAQTSHGNKVKMKQCTEAEAKAKKRLKGRRLAPREAAYCKGATGGSYVLFEKCIASLKSSREKMGKKLKRKHPGTRKKIR